MAKEFTMLEAVEANSTLTIQLIIALRQKDILTDEDLSQMFARSVQAVEHKHNGDRIVDLIHEWFGVPRTDADQPPADAEAARQARN